MLAGLFLILSLSGPGHGPGDGPVRVWLGSGGAISAGDRVRVYVQTAADGYVIVLHRGPDGSVRVLFPGDPATDPFTPAGTYEIRGADAAPAFTAPARGSGVVLAAVSPDPPRFAEFVAGGDWSAAALSTSWIGADAEGSLTDIVQRMLGDGSFNYALVTYTVTAPQSYSLEDTAAATATAPAASECVGCSYVEVDNTVILAEPLGGLLRHRHSGRFPNRAPEPAPQGATLAVYHGSRATVAVGPQRSTRPPALITITRPRREPATAASGSVRTLPAIVIVQPSRRPIATETRPEPVFARPTTGTARVAATIATPRQLVAPRAMTVVPVFTPRAMPIPVPTTTAASRSLPVGPPAFHTAGWHH